MSRQVLTNVYRLLHKAILLGALYACIGGGWLAHSAEPGEEEVEAAFLYRFAGYVEWPAEALSAPLFTIAVLGADGVAQDLQQMLPEHQLKNHPAQLRRIRRIEDLGNAQILFVGPQYNDELRRIIAQVADRPVLIVTASDHGLEAGSCVNFLLIDRRLRFEVSTIAAEHAGLKISAELLSVAVRVQGHGTGVPLATGGLR